MDQFTTHTGIGIPLRSSNVDTDQIVPSVYLKRVTRTGFEDALFAQWRRDPEFVLNQEPYSAGTVLVAGADFGIGSSREHAVWALRDYGVKTVLSSRFGDIFRANAGQQGLVTAQVRQADVEQIWVILERDPGAEITVDLVEQEVRCRALAVPFEIDQEARRQLLGGLDQIDLTCELEEKIAAFETRRPAWRPLTLPARGVPHEPVTPARARR